MHTIAKDQRVFSLSKDHEAVLTIGSGETIQIQTADCFSDALQTQEDKLLEIDFSQVNPATGPVYINNALPGDVLKIDILSIDLADQGCMITSRDFGVLSDLVTVDETKVFPIVNGAVEMFGLRIPMRKMIGVIGTAPAGSPIGTATPGPHGGNMDCTLIREGSTLYLPVEVEGALLALGDLHAIMGDGEVSGSAVEAAGSVTLKVEVLKNQAIPTPSVKTSEIFATIYSDQSMESASKGATQMMVKYLEAVTKLSFNEAYLLVSAIGRLSVCQVVDPLMTMRLEFPRSVLTQLTYQNR